MRSVRARNRREPLATHDQLAGDPAAPEHERALDALRESQARLQVVHAIATGISSGTPVAELIEAAVVALSAHFPDLRVAYGAIDPRGKITVLSSREARTLPPIVGLEADLKAAPAYLQALVRREPVVVEDVRADPRLEPLESMLAAGATGAVLDVPLHDSGTLVGLLSLSSPIPHVWTEHEIGTLSETADLLSAAIRHARTEDEGQRAEQTLRESEEEFRLAFENAKDAIFWADPTTGLITKCNRAAEILLEQERDEIIGQPQTALHPPQKAESYARMFRRHLEQHGALDDEAEVITRSGKIILVHITASVTSVGGRPIIQGIFRDITERKGAEEALRKSEEKYRGLVENINEVIYEVDAGGRIAYANPRVEEMGGYSPSEVIGQPFTAFVHPDDVPRVLEGLATTVGGHREPIEFRLLAKSGEVRWGRVFSRPVFEEDRIVGLRGVLTDITEIKQMEEALQRAREELEAKVERQLGRKNPYKLTFRELTVLHLVAAGRADKEIAQELGISPLTVHKHVANILAKMSVASRTEAGVRAVREGLVE